MKKITNLLLALALVLSCCPMPASAVGDGLCAHHAAHDENCGYFAGAACTHEHDEECLVKACVHHHGDCAYTDPQSGVDCDHDCADDTCGYRAAVEGVDCDCGAQPRHSESCAYVEAQEEIPCDHTHGECAYAEAVPGGWSCGHVCTQDSGCVTVNCAHEHGEDCGWQEAVSCTYLTNGCEACKNAFPSGEGAAPSGVTEEGDCTCESACGGDNGIDPNCSVCLEDFWNCIHFVPTCTCAEKCTAETVNLWCTVCRDEGASLEDCTGEDTGVPLVEYPIWVGETRVTGANSSNVTGPYIQNGTVSYDPDTNTLTLNNARITKEGIQFSGTLNLVLVGNNTVKGGWGIWSSSGSLTISGSGNAALTIDGDSFGLNVTNATINSGNIVIDANTYGMDIDDNLTINGGTVRIPMSGGSYAVNCGSLSVNGATFHVSGGYYGIYCKNGTIDNATVTVSGSDCPVYCKTASFGGNAHVTLNNKGDRDSLILGKVTTDGYSISEGSSSFTYVGKNLVTADIEEDHSTHTITFKDSLESKTVNGEIQYIAKNNTITKSCPVCGTLDTITLTAPENLTYDGAQKVVTVAGTGEFAGKTFSITYTQGETTLENPPVMPGTYTASLTHEGVTATLTFTIEKITPMAEDFTYAAFKTYNGQAQGAEVQATVSISGMGDITVKYYDEDRNLLNGAPVKAGTYTVKVDATESDNYNAAQDLVIGTFTIRQKTLTPSVTVKDKVYDGKTDAEVTAVELDGVVEGETLTMGTDFTFTAAFRDAGAGENKVIDYTVTLQETAAAANYTIGQGEAATAAINPALLTITADSHTVKVGSTMPTLTFQVTGLVGQETAAQVVKENPLTCAGDMNKAGDYAILVKKNVAIDPNYMVQTVQNGTLRVREEFPVNVISGNGGSVTVSPAGAIEGTVVTVTITPKSGYRFKGLTVYDADGDKVPVTIDGNGGYVFVMPNSEVSVRARFTAKHTAQADATNPKTGDGIYPAMTTLFLSAAALYVLAGKHKIYR